MDEANATSSWRSHSWIDESLIGLGVWIVFTSGIVWAAPVLADVGLAYGAVLVAPACAAVGWVLGRAFGRARPRPAAGARLGIAIVVIGQLLDTLLVALVGEYPRAGTAGSVTILSLLLAGYASALLGALLADRPRSERHRAHDAPDDDVAHGAAVLHGRPSGETQAVADGLSARVLDRAGCVMPARRWPMRQSRRYGPV